MARGIKVARSEKISRSAVAALLRDRIAELGSQIDVKDIHLSVVCKIRRAEVQLILNTILLKDF
jgi:hypothetical protein